MAIRTLIVDNDALFRKQLSLLLGVFTELEVIGTASNGDIALKKLEHNAADLVFLDVYMAGMDGLSTLAAIKGRFPESEIIMISNAGGNKNTKETIKALEKGAVDFITKPDTRNFESEKGKMIMDLKSILNLIVIRHHTRQTKKQKLFKTEVTTVSKAFIKPLKVPLVSIRSFCAVAIGVSTGGPEALAQIIPHIPENFGLPIFCVQHMPPAFTKSLAESLDRKSSIKVVEAMGGETAKPGYMYLAQGGRHMLAQNNGGGGFKISLGDGPEVNSCRPSVDVLFESLAACSGDGAILAVILTGMGSDGMRGVRALKQHKCFCITQSAGTCTIYGMPKAVDDAGLSDETVDLVDIAPRISHMVGGI